MNVEFQFDLEVSAKDVISGYEGIVIGRAEYVTGCNQYALKSTELTKDGLMRDVVWFDEERLVSKDLTVVSQTKFKFPVGSLVEEKYSGFTGIVTAVIEYSNSGDRYLVTPQSLQKNGSPSDGQWMDEGYLNLLGRGITKADVKSTRKGGPATEVLPR